MIKSCNVLASLAFADILVGIVVVPFSLTQVHLASSKFNNNLLVFSKYWDSGSSVTTGVRYEDQLVIILDSIIDHFLEKPFQSVS